MLFFSLHPDGGDFADPESGLACLGTEPALCDELTQVVDLGFDRARRGTIALRSLAPALASVPLAVHASYSREETLAALDHASMRGLVRSGPRRRIPDHAAEIRARLLTDHDVPGLRPQPGPLPLGVPIHHVRGLPRRTALPETRPQRPRHGPYIFLGPADYVSHTGDPPVAITWRLHRPMPTEVYLAARAAVA